MDGKVTSGVPADELNRSLQPYHNSFNPHRTNFVDNFVQQPQNNRAKALSGAACNTVPAKQAASQTAASKAGKSPILANNWTAPAANKAGPLDGFGQYAQTVAPAATPAVVPTVVSSITRH